MAVHWRSTQLCSYVPAEQTVRCSGWQRYRRITQECYRCHNRTNAGMQPGEWQAKSLDQPSRRGRELARLLGERLLGRLWRPRQVLFVANADDRTGSHRVAVRCIAAGLGRRAAVAGFRRSKFIINIRVLQAFASQSADSSSIAICTPCLLPWYLPQSRSRSDWRLGGDR